jgi:hypothetical protein
MPSKKKARSQARKAKKKEAKQQAAGATSCTHMKLPEDHASEELAAHELFRDFDTKWDAHYTQMGIEGIWVKCKNLDDVNKDMFRQLLIAKGVAVLLDAHQKGQINFASCSIHEMKDCNVDFVPFLMPIIGLLDLIDRPNEDGGRLNLRSLMVSPRELVRFFYRRSSCSCLKVLYYNLKDNTSKRTWCSGCEEISDAKNIFECECKRAVYCSRECAKRHWAVHKSECKAFSG